MRERPILFSAPMVRALLSGTKTQTRRVVKLPHENPLGEWAATTFGGPNGGRTRDGKTVPLQASLWHTRTGDSLACPHGQPGDRLWVREAWAAPHTYDHLGPSNIPVLGVRTHYLATEERGGLRWRPSIHMPRWVSRITLEITEVRVQRLQEISYEDALSEGVADFRPLIECVDNETPDQCARRLRWPQRAYQLLWEDINGFGSWDINPWVWAITTKVLTTP